MPQQRFAPADWANTTRPLGHATVAGSSWSRDDTTQVATGSTAEVPGWRNSAAVEPAPTQALAKLPFSTTSPASTAPVPVTAEVPPVPSGLNPSSSNSAGIDPALSGTWVGDAAAIKQAQGSAPVSMPEIITGPVRMPEIAVEPKQPPVAVAIDTRSLPPGSPGLRLVNTKRFSLSYTVQENGSGVAAVDLWETRDGKTWKKCDNAQTQHNAFVVEVKDEGVFGYTMVARPTGDKSTTQPKPGDVPQVWVTVDTTKPTVSLTGVELNLTSKVPNLIVRWTAKDRNFGPRPVSLSYAESADGPWLPLAMNVENSGRYEGPVPANLPKRAFLRIEAVDLVGNTGSAQTERLVRFDFTASSTTNVPPPQTAQATTEPARPLVIIKCVEPSTGAKE
jgi:hypothetical protein